MTRTIRKIETIHLKIPAKKRVAAYARVSCGKDTSLHSLSAQISYYSKYIQKHRVWEYAGVYAELALTGTKDDRPEFQRLLGDCREGKIDLVLTKSIFRFARNTLNLLNVVRELKALNVEVYFEKENIYSLDSKGELMLTIISSLAQEESRNLSTNIAWGKRKCFADGKVSLPYKRFLGFEKGEDGQPKIMEKEAKIVRLIYKLFLEGKTPSGIAKHLTERAIPTPGGKQKWQASTVASILTNEKHRGDARLQKRVTLDFLTKKMKINEGEVPQYYVENNHTPTISPETFELVQEEFRRRKAAGLHTSGINIFASRIVCGDCGSFYG